MKPLSDSAALCQVHPRAAAVLTCGRCGSFSCEECRSTSHPGLCQACAAREGAGIGQDVSAAGLLRDTFGLLVPNLPAVAVVAAVTLSWRLMVGYAILPAMGVTMPLELKGRGIPGAFQLISLLLMLATSAGFMRWVADGLLHAEDRTPARALSAAWRRPLLLGLMWLLFILAAAFGMVLLVIPGFYIALCHSLAPAALVLDSRGPVSALDHSRSIVKGHRLNLLIMWGALVAVTYALTIPSALSSIYLTRRGTPGEISALAITTALSTLSLCLLQIASVLAYLRLTRCRVPTP